MLKCKDDSIYVGVTNSLIRRLEEHNIGLNNSSYTYNKRPVELIFSQVFNSIEEAISFEKKIKKWSRAKKIALSHGEYKKLKKLSACKNDTIAIKIPLDSARGDNKEDLN